MYTNFITPVNTAVEQAKNSLKHQDLLALQTQVEIVSAPNITNGGPNLKNHVTIREE